MHRTGKMLVRLACHEDLPVLAQIHISAWQTAYKGMISPEVLDAIDIKHALTRLKPAMERPNTQVFVLEDHGEVRGFCRIGPSREQDVPPDTGEVFAINVAPSHWRKGYGKILLREVVSTMRMDGYQAITLWVLNDNHRALRFYEQLGFSADGATRVEAADSDWPLHEQRLQRLLHGQ
jgi:ribosomal protein S18 acetylase RimI-like enzyme